MNDLTTIDTMLVADSLIEYGIRNLQDEALFGRSLEVLRKIGSPAAADALERYRAAILEMAPTAFDANRVREYAPDTEPWTVAE